MNANQRRVTTCTLLLLLGLGGCVASTPLPAIHTTAYRQGEDGASAAPFDPGIKQTIRLVAGDEPPPGGKAPEELPAPRTEKSKQTEDPALTTTSRYPRPAYAAQKPLLIDLPTVIRLVDAQSPAVAYARSRVREAEARLAQANLQWLPNLSVGTAYTRFDGQTQNQRGEVFGVSRANLFNSGGPALSLDFAEAIYRPLIEQRQTSSEDLRSTAVTNGAELDAVLAYLDLVQVHAQLEINAETLRRAEEMLTAAQNAKDAKLDRTAGDVNRARSEVLQRRTERIDLQGKVAAMSARLGRLLLMHPNVQLIPADRAVVPVTLIDPNTTLDDLLLMAVQNRPDLAAHREAIAAAWNRVRRQQYGPFLPRLIVQNQTGVFGGGRNADLEDFSSRNALSVQLFWEIKNLGLGNHAEQSERQAQLDQAYQVMTETQARIAAEIVEAAQLAAARYESLDLAEKAVQEATELYRIQQESVTNVIDPKNLFDALRPLQAIQMLNQARINYLAAILDYTRAQYRLFVLIGSAPRVLPNTPCPPSVPQGVPVDVSSRRGD